MPHHQPYPNTRAAGHHPAPVLVFALPGAEFESKKPLEATVDGGLLYFL